MSLDIVEFAWATKKEVSPPPGFPMASCNHRVTRSLISCHHVLTLTGDNDRGLNSTIVTALRSLRRVPLSCFSFDRRKQSTNNETCGHCRLCVRQSFRPDNTTKTLTYPTAASEIVVGGGKVTTVPLRTKSFRTRRFYYRYRPIRPVQLF